MPEMAQSDSDNSCTPSATRDDAEWYYLHDGEHRGALTATELLLATQQGDIKHDTLVWQKEFAEWVEASSVSFLAEVFGNPSGKVAQSGSSSRADTEQAARNDEPITSSLIVEAEQSVTDERTYEELHDALSEEESEEPNFDEEQLRILLERTSYLPRERSIPPAIGVSIAPAAQSGRRLIPRRVSTRSIAIGSSLFLVLGLALMARATTTNRKLKPVAQATETSARGLSEPRLAARQDVASTDRMLSEGAGAKPNPAPVVSAVNDGATERDAWVEQGSFDLALLTRKVERALPVFDEQCWSKYRVPYVEVPANPSILVTLVIDRHGKVYDVYSTKAPRGYQGAGLCIIGRMRGWQFPPSEENSKAVVRVSRLPNIEASVAK